ncbi:thiosulfate:glutathione sulfurtransferase isoform X2 [Oryctolagus cuniculus]|uniref:thiosulfate:glutathione sulfurtransferase isoform X2 n=1 Tax=Oryctolagus cuniculus TaxID=9986 RepID=UPI00223263C8|nr:thiosulfate:glutathione sulfurtransferase isoform X2 [Oryctolagus cuniculus]XP_051714423.1 thiosulfate:glutathione sulfurtransferase isoform X2 [Oryctolagus cuniculus]
MCDLGRKQQRGRSRGRSTSRVQDGEGRSPCQTRTAGKGSPRVSELESALQMEPAAFQARYSAQKPTLEEENLVFFCQMGRRGSQAAQLARKLGYTGARNYAGAYREWLEQQG